MKIDFKTGLRRIILTLIGFGVLCALIGYCLGGFIFDVNKFSDNVKLDNRDGDQGIILTMQEFLDQYNFSKNNSSEYNNDFENYNNKMDIYDFKFYPYQQKIICERNVKQKVWKQNQKLKITLIDDKDFVAEYIVKMPSRLQYFMWQAQDFLLIFLIAGLTYGIYLLFEKVAIWIFQGFKREG